ncbi:MAG: glucose-6-phosphate isomerase, partial [Dehalococcoidia bacterium]|nr:glucose-6-phosphate isomerase [Dehalococcoidia bacterium]
MIPVESTLPSVVLPVLDQIDLARSMVILSSKSGTTIEPLMLYRVLRDAMDTALGAGPAGRRFAAITDPGTPLVDLARDQGFGKVFLGDPTIGGRFSALTHFGLVPTALLGISVESLVQEGTRMRRLCGPGVSPNANPAASLGAAIGSMSLAGWDKLTLVVSPEMFGFGHWVVQLVAESLGKDGKGIIPVAGEPPVDPDLYGDDRLFVYLRLDGDDNDSTDEAIGELSDRGHPVIILRMQSRQELGAEFFRWELAVAVAAAVIGVNPFDQPHVQMSKDRTRNILGGLRGGLDLTAGAHQIEQGARELARLLASRRDGDYLGILAFLPANGGVEGALRELRERAVRHYRLATTLGHGPGYLHSTGQLHKGGPATGIFLVLTAPHHRDAAIPGEPYSLGEVTDADSLGDLGALGQMGRRLVHVRLTDHSAHAVESLTAAIDRNALSAGQ